MYLQAVYYLACNNDLKMKIDPQIEARGHEDGDPGVVSGKCSVKLLEYAKRYVGPAHWLYIGGIRYTYIHIYACMHNHV
jgi:hypothetical protein